jgi:hypothetical protein
MSHTGLFGHRKEFRACLQADISWDIAECPRSADFVAEVRCSLFWSVIPSL